MKLNDNLNLRACVNTHQVQWENSPSAGVKRRRLEQDDDCPPVERVTTIVNFAPNSSFKGHVHPGGEEFLVLDGVFSDQHGDYPEGYYIRNPKGSGHAPFSKQGCTILVKLWQMHPEDQQQIAIDTTDKSLWKTDSTGVKRLELFSADYESVFLMEWPAETSFKELSFPAGVEYFVIKGHFNDDNGSYTEGSWLRLPADSTQNITVNKCTRVLIKEGHLLNPVSYV